MSTKCKHEWRMGFVVGAHDPNQPTWVEWTCVRCAKRQVRPWKKDEVIAGLKDKIAECWLEIMRRQELTK